MPFKEKPAGFSSHTLELLDVAMTKLWLEQVAIGASLSGASTAVRASLDNNVQRLGALSTNRKGK